MQAAFTALDGWLLRTTLGGGIVLLVGALWMLISRQPVKRQRIGELALLFALLVALPAALPAWWTLPGGSKTDALISYPGAVARDALPTREDPTEQSFVDDLETLEGFEILEILGIVDEQHQPVTIQAEAPEEFIQQASKEDTQKASGTGLFASSDSPWFLWMLRAYGLVYIAFVTFLLCRCAIGYYGLWRYWRIRRPAPAHVHITLAELTPDETTRPRIGVCPHVHGPVSYGLWKPTILLPPAFCNEGDPEKLRWILAHELTHLRRRDAWGCLLLALGGAVYFHLPWFWWLKRQVRLAQEYVADAAAAKIATAVDYAQYLVSLTTLTTRPTLASGRAAGVFETQSDLYRRVHMLLRQRNIMEGGAPRWWTFSAAASFLALAACTAGVQLYASEPNPKVGVVGVADDGDDKATDKKKDTKGTRVEFKFDDKDAKDGKAKTKVFRWEDGKLVQDDKAAKDVAGRWTMVLGDGQKEKIDEALKKLDQILSRLPKDERADVRAKLEEVKSLLKKLNSGSGVWSPDGKFKFQGGEDAKKWMEENRDRATKAEREARVRGEEAEARARATEQEIRRRAADFEARARTQERQARAAAERLTERLKSAKDDKDRDAVVKELEKAIAEKESQLKKLRDGAARDKDELMNKLKQGEADRAAASKARAAAGELLRRGAQDKQDSPQKPRLGVSLTDLEDEAREEAKIPEGQGVMITEVVEPSPAWNNGKGLKSGDILVEFAGKKVKSDLGAFVKQVAELKEGTYNAVVYRNGKKVNITGIKIAGRDEKPAKPKKGDGEDELAVNRIRLGEGDVVLNLNGELSRLNKVHGDAVVTLGDVSKRLQDGQIALELEGIRKNVEGIKDGLVTLKLDDVDGIRKNVDNLITLKLDDATKQGLVIRPEIVDNVVKVTPRVQFQPNVVSGVHMPTTVVRDDESRRVKLGVVSEPVPDAVAAQLDLADGRGLIVREVVVGSAAEKAGFQRNDIIIELANKPVARDKEQFSVQVRELKPGTYTATVLRKGKEMRIRNIVIADAKKDEDKKTKEWTVDDEKAKESKRDAAKAKAKDKDEFTRRAPRFNFMPDGNRSTSISVNNGEFTAKTTIDNDKIITVVGRVENGKANPRSITIKSGDEEKKYKSLNDVPDADREDVEKLVKNIRGSGNTIRFGPGAGNFNFDGNFGPEFDAQMKVLEEQMKQMRGQIGRMPPGLDQLEKQLEDMRKQLRDLNKNRNKDKDDDQK